MLMEPRGIDAAGTAIESEPTNEWLSGAGVLGLGQLGWSQPARIELPLARQLARQPPLIN